jgi:DNA-binding NtrC family response regulator
MSFSLRVVIADDDPGIRESLRQTLCDLGHQVVAVAETGESLINQCAKANPDVVITGTLTPQLYGSDAAAVVYKNRPIPIILYSGHCEPELVRNAEHHHVFMYLVKPICPEDLKAALENCCCAESNEPPQGDETTVPDRLAAPGSFGNVPYREHCCFPDRQARR